MFNRARDARELTRSASSACRDGWPRLGLVPTVANLRSTSPAPARVAATAPKHRPPRYGAQECWAGTFAAPASHTGSGCIGEKKDQPRWRRRPVRGSTSGTMIVTTSQSSAITFFLIAEVRPVISRLRAFQAGRPQRDRTYAGIVNPSVTDRVASSRYSAPLMEIVIGDWRTGPVRTWVRTSLRTSASSHSGAPESWVRLQVRGAACGPPASDPSPDPRSAAPGLGRSCRPCWANGQS